MKLMDSCFFDWAHSVAGSRHEDDEEPVYEVMSYLGGARPSLRHKQKVTETTELWWNWLLKSIVELLLKKKKLE